MCQALIYPSVGLRCVGIFCVLPPVFLFLPYLVATQVPSLGARRSLAASPAPPALWSAVHGMFDPDVPLTEPFPGVPTPTPQERPPVSPVRVTKLGNGARVASVDTGDRVSSVGLFVRAGSRYESAGANTGVCSLLEHMAFRGSARRSKFLQTRALEKTGASFGASASREVLIYSAEGMRAASGTLVAEITEAALQPMVMGATQGTAAWDAARAEIKTQAAAMAEHPQLSAGDASVELNELLHATAYNSVGLGMFLAYFLRRLRLFLRLPHTLSMSADVVGLHPKRESLYVWLRFFCRTSPCPGAARLPAFALVRAVRTCLAV